MAAPCLPDRLGIFSRFIEAVEDGETVRDACRIAGVSWRGVSLWMADDANVTEDGSTFVARYARARQRSADAFAERALHAALEAPETTEGVQRARLQVDVFKWRAAMANPKSYGDRMQHEVSGTVGVLHLDALRLASTQRNALPRTDVARDTVDAEGVSIQPIEAIPADTSRDDAEGPPSP